MWFFTCHVLIRKLKLNAISPDGLHRGGPDGHYRGAGKRRRRGPNTVDVRLIMRRVLVLTAVLGTQAFVARGTSCPPAPSPVLGCCPRELGPPAPPL